MPNFRNLTQYREAHLVSTTTTTQYSWFTDWMTADGITNIRAVLKCKNASGANFRWQLAIQYAAVRADNPGTPATLGNQQTNSGEYQTQDVPVGTGMDANRLFRLGIAYSSAQTGMEQGDVSLQASWLQLGTDLGSSRMVLGVVDSGVKYAPLTDWIPATVMSKVKAAFILTSITPSTGYLGYQFAIQFAGTTVAQPGAWELLGAGYTRPGANVTYEEHNSAAIAPAANTNMWFRLGVAYNQNSSGVDTNYTGVLDAFCSCQ